MNFKTVANGTSEGYCIVKTVEQKVNVKGVPYLDFLLSDAAGEINAKLWDYKESVHGKFDAGDFIKVRGTLSVYNGTDQFRGGIFRPDDARQDLVLRRFHEGRRTADADARDFTGQRGKPPVLAGGV